MTQKVNWGPKIQRCFHGVWKEVISKVGAEKGERSEGQTDRYMHTCTRGMGEGRGEEERGKERVRQSLFHRSSPDLLQCLYV